jgi:hypothetical protein
MRNFAVLAMRMTVTGIWSRTQAAMPHNLCDSHELIMRPDVGKGALAGEGKRRREASLSDKRSILAHRASRTDLTV